MGKQQHGPCQRSFNASLTVDVHGSRSPPHAHGEFGSALYKEAPRFGRSRSVVRSTLPC